MAISRCDNGHFYDDTKFEECPHCKNPPTQKRFISNDLTQYMPRESTGTPGNIVINMGSDLGDEKTVGIFRDKLGIEPVVGWLVCVKGREKGRSYNLHVGRNFIGRSLKSDIAIPDDETVSAEDHCSIVFEPNKQNFLLARGVGETVIINGETLQNSTMLQGDDSIEIGFSEFIFVPFCKEGRSW